MPYKIVRGVAVSTLVILSISITVFLGALTRTTFGFGEAVVSMPLLALLPIHLPTAIALMGLISLTVAAITVSAGWQHINRWELIPVVIAALAGIPVGLWMIASVPATLVTGSLGAALMAYGVYALSRKPTDAIAPHALLRNPNWGLVFGFVSGVFGSAYNFSGAPVAIYGSLRLWKPQTFRSTMQAYFLVSGTLIVIGQGMSSMWTANVFLLYLFSLPAVAAAVFVGTRLHQRIPTDTFQRYVYMLVAALGALLLVKSAIHYS